MAVGPTTHVLIAGAGPVGLSAALACRRKGFDVTIIDRAGGTTDQSRAVGISWQTLDLLQEVGAAEQILQEAEPLRGLAIHRDGEPFTTLRVPGQKRRHPRIVCLPQSRTEEILQEELRQAGITVDWDTELIDLKIENGSVIAQVARTQSGATSEIQADRMLGADGASSATRHALGIAFEGETLPGSWSIADVTCDWPFAPLNACADLHSNGRLLFTVTIGNGRYRAIANHPDALEWIDRLAPVREVHYQTAFDMNLRLAASFGDGPVALAGDAAHVHTPVGGQGMNFGIADAFAFADALENENLDAYRQHRRKIDGRLVRITTAAYRFMSASSRFGRLRRDLILKSAGTLTGALVSFQPPTASQNAR
ncbi:NAD(P)/FAD-dependent oxidoreductase [Notoacmeibacter sp. MSK16QG-6]|uniref:FAD-dependent oxidoreductase n=1 Tax=Notoacmeibacter sp. MSK16QG-6 TaxID=2957982 RepID=UPI00209FF283|nr:NAD(P)/FAD-dependent oxidoreductase [Notoacmeibacter sp. MSK16QG-6]MCP1200407.1 FAD-dependent monooxygenase [Notoacmeibacter sp. MSK16QG-6]